MKRIIREEVSWESVTEERERESDRGGGGGVTEGQKSNSHSFLIFSVSRGTSIKHPTNQIKSNNYKHNGPLFEEDEEGAVEVIGNHSNNSSSTPGSVSISSPQRNGNGPSHLMDQPTPASTPLFPQPSPAGVAAVVHSTTSSSDNKNSLSKALDRSRNKKKNKKKRAGSSNPPDGSNRDSLDSQYPSTTATNSNTLLLNQSPSSSSSTAVNHDRNTSTSATTMKQEDYQFSKSSSPQHYSSGLEELDAIDGDEKDDFMNHGHFQDANYVFNKFEKKGMEGEDEEEEEDRKSEVTAVSDRFYDVESKYYYLEFYNI